MRSTILFFTSLLLLVGMTPPATATNGTMPEIFFILDASGSMWGDAGGITKIEAAKSVLESAVTDLPDEVLVGFAAYGHRREKDCSDVEILVMPGSGDRAGLVDKVRVLQPKGMTPIARSCREVAGLLRDKENETTIVLVSDGIETCDEDPCEVVRALRAEGIRFVMHVIGFGVDQNAKTQLECVAAAGGGRYFGAADSDSLLAALRDVGEEVAKKVEQAKSVTVKKKTRLGKLRLTMPESALISLAGIRIVRVEDDKEVKNSELKGSDTMHPLLAGEYKLFLSFANSNTKPPTDVSIGGFTIAGGETTGVTLGAILFNVADGLVDNNLDAVSLIQSSTRDTLVTIRENGNDWYLFKPKPVPAGEYDFVVHYYRSVQPSIISKTVSVASGEETYITLDSGIQLEESNTGVTGWDLHRSGSDAPLITVRRGWDNSEPLWRRFIVPPGTYDLYVRLDGMDEPLPVGEGIEIGKGKTVRFETGL